MVPKEYQGNVGNCIVAIELSGRMGMSPFEVMQNMYLVHGRPSWKAEFVLSRLHMKFKDVEFEHGTEDGGRCRLICTRHDGKVLTGNWVSMKMAKAEGWTTRSGTKWATMPEQMIMYRAATFFARLHAPDVLAGVPIDHEATDAGYLEKSNEVQAANDAARAAAEANDAARAAAYTEDAVIDDAVVDVEITEDIDDVQNDDVI